MAPQVPRLRRAAHAVAGHAAPRAASRPAAAARLAGAAVEDRRLNRGRTSLTPRRQCSMHVPWRASSCSCALGWHSWSFTESGASRPRHPGASDYRHSPSGARAISRVCATSALSSTNASSRPVCCPRKCPQLHCCFCPTSLKLSHLWHLGGAPAGIIKRREGWQPKEEGGARVSLARRRCSRARSSKLPQSARAPSWARARLTKPTQPQSGMTHGLDCPHPMMLPM